MPTNHDETLPQRYEREHQAYLKLCGSMTAEQVADLQLQLNNSLAREQALQALLTAADEQIDLLSPRPTEQPEGKRERFEKWVMATKHPVYGFLDGRSLARGDDRTGYADEYVQGLWVAYLAFGAEQLAPVPVVRCSFCDVTDQDGNPWSGGSATQDGILIYRVIGCKDHKHLADACLAEVTRLNPSL